MRGYIYLLLTILIFGISPGLCIEVAYIFGEGPPHTLPNSSVSPYSPSDKINFTTGGGNAIQCGASNENISQIQKIFNIRVQPNDDDIRFNSVELAKDAKGPYNIGQICCIYDFLTKNWMYVSDPKCEENYQNASESLKHGESVKHGNGNANVRGGAGDCNSHGFYDRVHLWNLPDNAGQWTKWRPCLC
jgi:hypothetical protein